MSNDEWMNTELQIRQFLREFFILGDDLGGLDDDGSFLENGVVDSTGVLELVLFAEETFGIEVDDEEVVPANFDSISRLAAYIEAKRECLDSVGASTER